MTNTNPNERVVMSGERKEPVWEVPAAPPRTSTGMRVAVVLLTVLLIGSAIYGYKALRQHSDQLSQLPSLEQSLSALSGRMDAAETKLTTALSDWQAVADHVAKLDRKVSANLQLARRQTQEMVSQLRAELRSEMNQRAQALETRMDHLESAQASQRAQLAQFDEKLAASTNDTRRELASLHEEVAENRSHTGELARRIEVERVNFEARRNSVQEIVPGVSLKVTKTNVSYQRFNGWAWLLPDRRTLWIRNQNVEQPVVFYRKETGERYELVVTDVSKDFVLGYVLRPAPRAGSTGESSGANVGGGS